jgi:hypothetical protein
MLRRSLLVSAILLASSFGFAGSAKAAKDDAYFEGKILATCAIEQTAAGTLASADGKTLSSSSTVTDGTATGAAATISVECPGGTVEVGTPVPGFVPGSTLTNSTAASSTLNTATVALDGDTDLIVDTAVTTVTGRVNMTATSTTPLPVGDYGYSVLVTVTPAAPVP